MASCWQVGRNSKKAKKTKGFSRFFGTPAFQLQIKIDKKTSPDRSKFKQKFGQHLDPFFDGFWEQLGSIFGKLLAAKLEPCWHQMASKPNPKTNQKTTAFWKASGTNFNQFMVDLGSNLGGPGESNEPAFW